MDVVLGLDGGQTSTAAVLAALDGAVIATVTVGPWDTMGNEAGQARCRAALTAAVPALLRQTPADCRLVAAGLGLTGGRTGAETVEAWLRELAAREPGGSSLGPVAIAADTAATLLGADPSGGPGVVVIAGGGSAAWGHDGAGRSALAGAHGYLLDDVGSAYEMGRQAIIAALQAEQGRRPPTALTAGIAAHFGADSMWAVRQQFYSGAIGRPETAALLPLVVQTAAAGDEAAAAVLSAGAGGLAELAAAVIRRLQLNDARVYPAGGVFRAGAAIRVPFRQRLAELEPTAAVCEPALPPLGGAVLLGLQAAGVSGPALTAAAAKLQSALSR